jgi:hypothetical protein
LRIEVYFQRLWETIDACPAVRSFNVTYDKRGSYEGFIRGEVYFADDSILHLREFVDVEFDADRLTYAYQYVDPTGKLVFRYDNTGHHKELNLPTYPHPSVYSARLWARAIFKPILSRPFIPTRLTAYTRARFPASWR